MDSYWFMMRERAKVIRSVGTRAAVVSPAPPPPHFVPRMGPFCEVCRPAGTLVIKPRVARSPSSRNILGLQLATWQKAELSHTQSECLISRTFPGVNIGAYPTTDAAI